ncbi:hypothetical protein Tco_0413299 [Tanacetum coccineum]
MSSPNRSTSDIEDAFSSMNILNYTSVSSDYFPASSGSSSFNSSENSTDNIIPPVFSSFYNNPCLKDVQAFYAKESSIPPPDPITPPAILTSSPVLPPSLLFDPRYFFVPEELLPKKQIHPSSSTSSNSSRKQDRILVPPSSSTCTPTPPQIYKIGKKFLSKIRISDLEMKRLEGYPRSPSTIYEESYGTHFVNSKTTRLKPYLYRFLSKDTCQILGYVR